MVEQGDRWFQSETYLMKIASIMATIVEIRQGLSEDSSLRLKANLALERLGQLANGEIKVEGNKVMLSESRPWFLSDTPRQAAIRELYESTNGRIGRCVPSSTLMSSTLMCGPLLKPVHLPSS
jgi:hypothetical protein